MSSQSRSSRRSTVDKSVLKWTTFLYLSSLLPSYATELPTDIWNGGHGGFPSVTANHSGVSVTLPQQAIIDAGGGPLDKLVKGFLDRWAPEMCSDLFDFQHSHERMTLSVAVHRLVQSGDVSRTDYRLPAFSRGELRAARHSGLVTERIQITSGRSTGHRVHSRQNKEPQPH